MEETELNWLLECAGQIPADLKRNGETNQRKRMQVGSTRKVESEK